MTGLYLSSGFWVVVGPFLLGILLGILIGRMWWKGARR